MPRTLDSKRLRPTTIVDAVAGVVQRGGIVIFPTDTVYGIGCDPVRADSVDKIFALKGRPRTKPLALHFGSVEELLEYAPGNAMAEALAREFLPGPLTVIVRRPAYVGGFVTAGMDTVGLRVPKHALCQAMLERSGPLAATSANFSGEPAFVGAGFASGLPAADLRIDDGPTPLGVESTVIDVSGERARAVREGAIGLEVLERIVGRLERPGAEVGER
jgi:L-threonylcarbamoyladenylate synthase